MKYYLRQSGRHGFTLMEILISVSIVVVLASLLIAGADRVLRNSANARCVSNLRTLAAAHLLYTADHNGQFISYDTGAVAWTAGLRDAGCLDEDTGAFFCPAFSRESDLKTPFDVANRTGGLGTSKRGIYSHYGYNYLHIGSSRREGGSLEPAKLSSLSRPSRTILLAESIYSRTSTPARGYYLIDDRVSNTYLPDGRHNGINIAFADGHVSMLPMSGTNPWASPPNGIGTFSDSDSIWIR